MSNDVPIRVFFVTPASANSAQPFGSPLMNDAYKSLKKRNFDCTWLEQSKILKKRFNPVTSMFVMDTFAGPAFDHLVKDEIRIISPLIIKYCNDTSKPDSSFSSSPSDIKSKTMPPFNTIPKRTFPIYSQCMRGLNITCTNFSHDKKRYIEEKIILMCGNFQTSLDANTHFLISNSVLTRKYQAAVQLKKPVMAIEWIEKCWESYQFHCFRANEPEIIARFRLPIFYGLTFTVSQLPAEEKAEIEKIINENGGTYSAALKLGIPNTILLINDREGEKYSYAKKKAIPCVRVEWLHDSLKAGFALSDTNYRIDAEEACPNESTNDYTKATNSLSLSFKPRPLFAERRSVLSSKSVNANPPQPEATANVAQLNAHLNKNKALSVILDELTKEMGDDANVLDDRILFLHGFDAKTSDSIKKAAKRCGGFTMGEFKADLNPYIIVGPAANKEELTKFKGHAMVSIDWLIHSMKRGVLCGINEYPYVPSQSTASGNSSSGGHLSMDEILKNPAELKKRLDITNAIRVEPRPCHPSQNFKSLGNDSDEDDVVIVPKDWTPSKGPAPAVDNKTSTSHCPTSTYKRCISNQSTETEPDTVPKKRLINDDDDEEDDDAVDPDATIEESDMEDEDDEEENESPKQHASPSYSPSATTKIASVKTSGTATVSIPTKRAMVFMFSGFDPDEKDDLTQQVSDKLGIRVLDSASITAEVTHLLLSEPYATEKTLSALAAGIYIMHPDFVRDSLEFGAIQPETEYEWGLSKYESQIIANKESNSIRKKLMEAAITWRQYVAETGDKAFQGWRVLVVNHTRAMTSSIKILEAGGAAVVYQLEDYANDEAGLRRLLPQLRMAIVDMKGLTNLPRGWSRDRFLKWMESLIREQKLFQDKVISRFISEGNPDGTILPQLRLQLTLEQMKSATARFE